MRPGRHLAPCLSLVLGLSAAGGAAHAQASTRAPGLVAPLDIDPPTTLPRMAIAAGPDAPADDRSELLRPGPGRVPLDITVVDGRVVELGRSDESYVVVTSDTAEEARITRERVACVAPCTLYVPPGMFPLFARSRGFAGATYHVPVGARGGRVRLRGGDVGLNRFGTVLTVLGVVTAAVGAIVLFVGVGGGPPGVLLPGGVIVGAGAAALAAGIPLITLTGPALLDSPSQPDAPRAAMLGWRAAF